MRLITTRATGTEREIVVKTTGRREWRWSLNADRAGIYLQREWRTNLGEPNESGWMDCYLAYACSLSLLKWRLGFHCMYYDGEHRIINLGPLQIYWRC